MKGLGGAGRGGGVEKWCRSGGRRGGGRRGKNDKRDRLNILKEQTQIMRPGRKFRRYTSTG